MSPSTTAPRRLGIVGPTASGKSDLAHRVALRLGDVEIITVDSMQVYRGMDIGTAKPTTSMRDEVTYHLIDIADPTDDFALAEYQAAAREAIGDIVSRGRRPMLVGGTGLYLRAIVDGLEIPGRWPAVRHELDARSDTEALHAELARLDPTAAARMEPTNRRRIVRALEVCLGSGRPFSSFGDGLTHYPVIDWDLIALDVESAELADRIGRRLAQQMNAGFLGEVRALVERGGFGRTAAQALGYRQLIEHLEGRLGLAEAVEAAEAATRRFARRQRSWFRRDPRLVWRACTTGQTRSGLESELVQRWSADPPGNLVGWAGPGRGRLGVVSETETSVSNDDDRLALSKLHGLGNDFLVFVDEVGLDDARLAALARRLCDRHRGVGADGLLCARSTDRPDRWVMSLHNADGSRAEMSGNGIRCFAHAIVRHENPDVPFTLHVLTDAGKRSVTVDADSSGSDETMTATVSMGRPTSGPTVPDVPPGNRLPTRSATWDLGNPHLVLLVDDPASVDLEMEGPAWERCFPQGMNVHFVAVTSPELIVQYTWERGAGVTEACGTGATAAALSAQTWGLVGSRVQVQMPGGSVCVDLSDEPHLTGPSEWIADVQVHR